ncbi:MAG: 4'-phosphopantetheinyl transferase superfamily protein [Bacteroidetes bacterium]|nr:MAG: 4'-phosphopantetheinyl transferase superfamily protein [Bacteroidota bacterium]
MRKDVQALFPPGVAGHDVRVFDQVRDLHSKETMAVKAAGNKRVKEFAAGRYCARKALSKLGYGEATIPQRKDRSPEWPGEIVGSISHTNSYCGAVVAWSNEFAGLGFDVETQGVLREDVVQLIATEKDIRELCHQNYYNFDDSVMILFSAKEAFYKAQFKSSRTFLDFQEVEFRFIGANQFEITLLRDVAKFATSGARFTGQCLLGDQHVFTGVALKTSDLTRLH